VRITKETYLFQKSVERPSSSLLFHTPHTKGPKEASRLFSTKKAFAFLFHKASQRSYLQASSFQRKNSTTSIHVYGQQATTNEHGFEKDKWGPR